MKNLFEKPSINIETIKVSREVLLESVDLDTLRAGSSDAAGPSVVVRGQRRRNGMSIHGPPKPK